MYACNTIPGKFSGNSILAENWLPSLFSQILAMSLLILKPITLMTSPVDRQHSFPNIS